MATSLDLGALLKPRRVAPPSRPDAIPAVLADVRQNVATNSLDNRCEVLRFLSVEDETGGVSEMWTQAGAYPCRIEQAGGGSEGNSEATGVQSVAPYVVYLPRWAQVKAEDRLGVPGWFNVWKPVSIGYEIGARIILPEFDGFVYECIAFTGNSTLTPDADNAHWNRSDRAQFLEVTTVIDAVEGADVLSVMCKDVE